MTKVNFYDSIDDSMLKFAVIIAKPYHFDTVLYVIYIVAFLVYPNCTHAISVHYSSLSKVSFFP